MYIQHHNKGLNDSSQGEQDKWIQEKNVHNPDRMQLAMVPHLQSNTVCNRLNTGLALKHTYQLLLLRVVCVCCLIADVVTQD
jgi:hypothetical protein